MLLEHWLGDSLLGGMDATHVRLARCGLLSRVDAGLARKEARSGAEWPPMSDVNYIWPRGVERMIFTDR